MAPHMDSSSSHPTGARSWLTMPAMPHIRLPPSRSARQAIAQEARCLVVPPRTDVHMTHHPHPLQIHHRRLAETDLLHGTSRSDVLLLDLGDDAGHALLREPLRHPCPTRRRQAAATVVGGRDAVLQADGVLRERHPAVVRSQHRRLIPEYPETAGCRLTVAHYPQVRTGGEPAFSFEAPHGGELL